MSVACRSLSFMDISEVEIRRRLAEGTTSVRRRAAGLRGCPPELLLTLTTDRDQGVVNAAWSNPSMPAGDLETFLIRNLETFATESYSARIRRAYPWALRNVSTPPTALDTVMGRLYRQPRLAHCMMVLLHPNCPRAWLEWAIGDRLDPLPNSWAGTPSLRAALAENPALPADLAARLLADRAAFVRVSAVRNRGIPVALLEAMPVDEDKAVLRMLIGRLTGPAQRGHVAALLALDPSSTKSLLLIARRSSNAEQVTALCWDARAEIREAAALNPNASDSDRVAVALQR